MAYQFMVSFSIFLVLPSACAVLGCIMLAWGRFLDNNEHDPGRSRVIMLFGLLVATVVELDMGCRGEVHPLTLAFSLVANLWGGLDAVLRFPAKHTLESFFGKKQTILIAAKTFACILSCRFHSTSFATLLVMLLIDVWGLPVLFLMALPMNPKEQVLKNVANDIDIVLRIWRLVRSPDERQHYAARLLAWWYRKLTGFSERSSLALFVVSATSPEHRRRLQRRGRCV